MHRFENFFEYQKALCRATLLPYLRRHGLDLNGKTVGDVGCGEGGFEAVLAEEYPAISLTGMDAMEKHVRKAQRQGIPRSRFLTYSILDEPSAERFDFVLFRDVLEYTADPKRALTHLKQLSAPGGLLFVAFPPYWSAYGGHQHLVRKSFIKAIPYIHLLPDRVFYALIAGQSAEQEGAGSFIEGFLDDLKRIRTTKISIAKFRHLISELGFSIISEELYLIRPSIAFRYNLPIIKNPLLGRIPGLRELTTSGALYLLRK